MTSSPIKVAWISYFPVEWLEDLPPELATVPKAHPATWQRVLYGELAADPRFELHLVSLAKEYPRTMSFQRGTTTFHLIKTVGGLRAPTLFWYDTFLIRGILKKIRPHVVHAWGMERGAGMVAARLGYPWLVTMQGLLSWLETQGQLPPYLRFSARLERRCLHSGPLLTAESRFVVAYIQKHFPPARVRQIEHAPSRVFQRVTRRPDSALVRFLYTGTVSQLKGFDVLAQALAQLGTDRPWRLTVIGSGTPGFVAGIRASVPPAVWERFEWRDHLSSDEVAAELARARLMLFPTRGDTSPNAVKEAAVVGVPVVASNVGGIPDYIFDGKNGVLVEPGNPEALAAAILKALDHPLFGKGLVDAATLRQVRAYLAPEVMAEKFGALYLELAAGTGR